VIADHAGKEYWDAVWTATPPPKPIAPRGAGVRHYADRRFHEYFRSIIPQGPDLLEVGCARSAWLPYFAQEFDATIAGLDYSELGCEMERALLRRHGLRGEIVCADMFSPPTRFAGHFDVVVSFGVIEHFADTANALTALARYLKPGGLLLTVIPNMTGLVGWIEKSLNPAVYGIHVPLGRSALADAQEGAGLRTIAVDLFMATNFGVLNLNGLDP